MRSTNTLWSKNFTIITLGTIISAIGGVGIHFCMGLVVFDNTHSTFLAGLFGAISMLPTAVLPIFVSPYVDKMPRKNMIVRLDLINGIFYLLFTIFLFNTGFSYVSYILFGLVSGSIGTIYQLTYTSLYPELITKGFAQKGYSISALIYPSVNAVFTPIAAFIYTHLGISYVFLAEGVLLLVAAFFEQFIDFKDENRKGYSGGFSFKKYSKDLADGFTYLKKEKGIRSVYTYMVCMFTAGNGNGQMTMAHFQSTPGLGPNMLALLTTCETIGRMIGGVFHYFVRIPFEKRYWIAEKVYMIYTVCDGILLFVAYPLMLILRFFCGFLGVNSMTLRESAVQNYIPSDMRARVNAVFMVVFAICGMIIQITVGAVGELLKYKYVTLLIAVLQFAAIFLIVVRNKKHISLVYNREH